MLSNFPILVILKVEEFIPLIASSYLFSGSFPINKGPNSNKLSDFNHTWLKYA
jgi:hypothetical protein